jgi:hypothetical protein
MIDMRGHLAGLVGQTIETITGRPNKILDVTPAAVIVATTKSPAGREVELVEIQAAADRLEAGEEVVIEPASVGYRSAFVGAALKSLPNTEVLRDPQRIRLRR